MPLAPLSAPLRQCATAFAELSKALEAMAVAVETGLVSHQSQPRETGPTERDKPISLNDLRRVKAKNVSWQQLIRGGYADLDRPVNDLRRSDKSLARRVARDAGITVAELVRILEAEGISEEE